MSPKPAFISFDRPASHPASPEGLVLFDFAPGQAWKNATGTFIVGIQEKTPSGRFVIYTKDTIANVIEAHQRPFDTEALIGFIREKECLVKSEASLPAKKSPGEKPVTEPAPSKVVADMNEAREQRGMDPIPVGLEQQNALFSDIERLTNEIVSALEGINSKLKAVSEILEGVEENESVDTIKIQVLEISQRAGALLEEDDVADVAQKGKVFTQEYVDAKRERLEGIKVILTQAEDLSEGVRAAMTEMSTQTEVTMAASGESGAVAAGSGEGAPAEKKKKPVRKGTGGGGDGTEDDGTSEKSKASKPKRVKRPLSDIVPEPSVVPMGAGVVEGKHKDKTKGQEAPEEFGGVLENLRTEVLGLIDAIKTPEEYVALRRGMVIAPPKDGDTSPRYHFFDLEDIKDRVRRVISDEELKQVQALERELREATRIKFLRLEYDDLNEQYNREQAKVDAAKNQTACQAIADRWTKKPNINFIWKDVLDDLTEREQIIVSQDYQRRSEELSENLHKKRESFRIASVEARGAREGRGEETKEPSNEVLFSGLVDALRKRESLSFGKDVDKKELIIDDIADTEIKFTYDGKPAKTQPQYVKKFLKFLKEKFSWSFGEMSQKEREMREIGLALEKIIQEKKNEAKISFDAMPGDEKKKIQQKYDNWMAFLDDNWRDAERLFEEGQLVVLRKMLKVFQQEEFWESQPDETAPKVEKIEEKTFEVLAEMLSARKKEQCVSVVSEGLAPLGQYAESQGLSLRSIVESMGIEKTAEGLVASLDDILPSEWGKEERSRFALQFAQREIEESLE